MENISGEKNYLGQESKLNSETEQEFCLWRRGGLASLSDMQTYFAKRLCAISKSLTGIGMASTGENFDDDEKKNIKLNLAQIGRESGSIGLEMTEKGAKRLFYQIDAMDLFKDLAGALDELERRFADEIEGVQFFWVKPEALRNYENTTLAGEQFKSRFPRANTELIEAGNCLALDRYTACVCHIVRALDIALSSLEKQLSIPSPTKGAEKTWGKILGRIKDKLTQNDKTPPADWPAVSSFYWKAYAFLEAFKAPVRDDTMHVKSVYDEQSANNVFNAALPFLNHIAPDLTE